MTTNTALVLVSLRLATGATLTIAGIAKLLESHESLQNAISAYGLMPHRFTGVIARLLPFIEITVGISMSAGFFMPIPGLAAVLLSLVFAGFMTLNLVRGRIVPCACFGVRDVPISRKRVLINLLMAGWALVATAWPPGRRWARPFELVPLEASIDHILLLATALTLYGGMILVTLILTLLRLVRVPEGKQAQEVQAMIPGA